MGALGVLRAQHSGCLHTALLLPAIHAQEIAHITAEVVDEGLNVAEAVAPLRLIQLEVLHGVLDGVAIPMVVGEEEPHTGLTFRPAAPYRGRKVFFPCR